MIPFFLPEWSGAETFNVKLCVPVAFSMAVDLATPMLVEIAGSPSALDDRPSLLNGQPTNHVLLCLSPHGPRLPQTPVRVPQTAEKKGAFLWTTRKLGGGFPIASVNGVLCFWEGPSVLNHGSNVVDRPNHPRQYFSNLRSRLVRGRIPRKQNERGLRWHLLRQPSNHAVRASPQSVRRWIGSSCLARSFPPCGVGGVRRKLVAKDARN